MTIPGSREHAMRETIRRNFEQQDDELTKNVREYERAVAARDDVWVVACGGTEVPAKYADGDRWIYVFNPARAEHGWLNLRTDVVSNTHPNEGYEG